MYVIKIKQERTVSLQEYPQIPEFLAAMHTIRTIVTMTLDALTGDKDKHFFVTCIMQTTFNFKKFKETKITKHTCNVKRDRIVV